MGHRAIRKGEAKWGKKKSEQTLRRKTTNQQTNQTKKSIRDKRSSWTQSQNTTAKIVITFSVENKIKYKRRKASKQANQTNKPAQTKCTYK